MKITKANAVKGTKVKLTTTRWGDSSYNPVWGGTQGKIEGTVDGSFSGMIAVTWDNKNYNTYGDNDLETVVEVPAAQSQPVVTVATLSLNQAIESVVKTFVSTAKAFSAFDITKALRKEINEKRIALDDRPFGDVNGVNTQFVKNDEVRGVVRKLVDANSNYYRDFNGDFIIYKPNASGVLAAAAQAPVKSAPVSTAVPAPVVTHTPTAVVKTGIFTPSSQTGVSSVKLLAYVDSKKNPTLKQIQSRFKGISTTVRSLETLVRSSGLRIDRKTPFYASVVTR